MKRMRSGKSTGILRRIGAGLLSLAIGASVGLGALPAGTAYAAGTGLTIQLTDAETGTKAQGLARMESRQILYYDVTDFYKEIAHHSYVVFANGETPALSGPMKAYVRDGAGYREAVQADLDKGTGLLKQTVAYHHYGDKGTFDHDEPVTNGHSIAACYKGVDLDGNGTVDEYRWTAQCLEKHTSQGQRGGVMLPMSSKHSTSGTSLVYNGDLFQEGHIYVAVEGGNLARTAYCYAPNAYASSDKNFYACFQWGSGSLYFETGGEMGTKSFTMDHVAAGGVGRVTDMERPRAGRGYDIKTVLTNEVMRGGFSFNVKDVETGLGKLQTMAMPSGSVFAVFNINATAIAPDGYADMDNTALGYPVPKSDAKATGAGVVVRHNMRDQTGTYKPTSTQFSQSYSYDDVIDAYDAYLKACNETPFSTVDGNGLNLELSLTKYLDNGTGIRHYTGMYGYGSYEPLTQIDPRDICSGLFDLTGKYTDPAKGGIWPCAMLVADDNGKVSTGANAFPAGNYLILQVRSPGGYYIDENFRLGVAIGPWFYDYNLDVTSVYDWGSMKNGYGNVLFGQFAYTMRDTSFLSKGTQHFVNTGIKNNYKKTGTYPVAYLSVGGERAISSENCDDFFVSSAGETSNTLSEDDNINYRQSSSDVPYGMGNKGNYVINNTVGAITDGKIGTGSGSVGSRRYPKVGDSRLEAHIAPVRAGVSFELADADDLAAHTASGSPSGYTPSGQGDARLEGAEFRLYHDSSTGNDALGAYIENGRVIDSIVQAGREKVNSGYTSWFGVAGTYDSSSVTNNTANTWSNKTSAYRSYWSEILKNGRFAVNIPVDDMPYGEYTLVEVTGGEGYGSHVAEEMWAAHNAEELTASFLRALGEDTVYVRWGGKDLNKNPTEAKLKEVLGKYTVGTTTYLPQSIYRDDAVVSVSLKNGTASEVAARIAVFNISSNLVYINGKQVATAKTFYEAGIEGKSGMSMDSLANIVKSESWQKAKLWEGEIKAGSSETENLKQLPYGTYLIAVLDVVDPTGSDYAPLGGSVSLMTVRENQLTSCAVVLADKAAIPVVSADLTDTATGSKSVAVNTAGSLNDKLSLSNLQEGVSYTAYAMLLDQATGRTVPGSKISTASVAAYASNGNGGSNVGDAKNLANLIATGETFQAGNMKDAGYDTWILSVRQYTNKLPGDVDAQTKAEITELVTRQADTNRRTYEQHSSLLGKLKFLNSNAQDNGMTGTDEKSLDFTNLDTRNLEGHILTGQVFILEGGTVENSLLNAQTVSDFRTLAGSSLAAELTGSAAPGQTVYVPTMDISAVSGSAGLKRMENTDYVRAVITYGNLQAGESYRITGRIVDGKGNEIPAKSGNGNNAGSSSVSVSFTPSGPSGSIELKFDNMDASSLNGQRLTVYATLYRENTVNNATQSQELLTKGDAQSMGWTANSNQPGKNQVDVSGPTVKTVLTDTNGSKGVDLRSGSVRLRDRVTYTDLIPNEKYKSVLTLKYPNGNDVLDSSGKAVTATAQFTARSASSSTVDITAAFNGTGLTDNTVVAFNDLYHVTGAGDVLVVSEHDLENKDQTVTDEAPASRTWFQTSARDDATGTQYTQVGTAVPVTDHIRIQGLDPEGQYVLKTTVADAKTGSVISQINEVSTPLTAGTKGVIETDVKLSINTQLLAGKTLVVYQKLYDPDGLDLIADHSDPKDTAQMLYVPWIDTYATGTDNTSKTVYPEKKEHSEVTITTDSATGELKSDEKITYKFEAVIRDRVEYANLVPGNSYTLRTKAVIVAGNTNNGHGAGSSVGQSETKFSPADAAGSVQVDLTVDAANAMGKSVVITQELVDDYTGKTVLVHDDLSDPDQTVAIGTPGGGDSGDPDDPDNPGSPGGTGTGTTGTGTGGKNIQTGVAEHYGLYFALAGLFMAVAIVIGGFAVYRRKRH